MLLILLTNGCFLVSNFFRAGEGRCNILTPHEVKLHNLTRGKDGDRWMSHGMEDKHFLIDVIIFSQYRNRVVWIEKKNQFFEARKKNFLLWKEAMALQFFV